MVSVPGYELLEPLESVARGAVLVYVAKERRSGRTCELSILETPEPPPPDQEDRQLRFLDEGRRFLGFSHTNVARIYDVGSRGGTAWIAQEIVDGRSLHDVLESTGERLPVETGVAIGIQLASALDALADVELVHRDVNPKTILVSKDGRVVLGGLGLGIESSYERLNHGDVPHGGVDYLSPEQVDGEGVVGPRTDVYGLGATLYRCLTGRVPHSGSTLFTRLRAIAHDTPPDVREVAPDVPDELALCVARFMEWDADDRPLSKDTLMYLRHVVALLDVVDENWDRAVLAGLLLELKEDDAAEADSASVTLRLRGTDRTIDRCMSPGDVIDVGRAKSAGISLAFAWVSRRHAQIERRPEGVVLVDLGSSNGVTHNGGKLAKKSEVLLANGDMVAFGKSAFQVLFLEAAKAVSDRRCASCGQDVGHDPEDEGAERVCLRCQVRADADREAAEHRIRLALEEARFEVVDRLAVEGAFKRFRVKRRKKAFIASAMELGQRTAKPLADASSAAFGVSHPQVIPTVDIEARSGILIVVSESHPGRTLETLVQEQGPLAPQAVVNLGKELARILHELMTQGVSPPLLRPETILLDTGGAPRLLDVGLAPGLLEAARTRSGWAPQPCYEPEELTSGQSLSPPTIVFSLGASLSYATTGTPVAETRAGERYDHLPLTMVAQVPRALALILARSTAPNPSDRYPTPADLLRALAGLTLSEAGGEGDPTLSSDEQTWASGERNPFDPNWLK
jgi:serine/threonine protein kinase